MKELLDIQRFSLHDGDGIRTTVFFKGCRLRCPWCANPENLSDKQILYVDEKRCIKGSGQCILDPTCPGSAQSGSGRLYTDCPADAVRSFGKYYTVEELLDLILRDRGFYEIGGGVTFSGGEPLLHTQFLAGICEKLKNEHIGIGFETSLFADGSGIEILKEYADLCYADIKILDKVLCRKILGTEPDLYFENIKRIRDIREMVIFRIPIVPGYTDGRDNLVLIKDLIRDFQPKGVEIFSVHGLAAPKYRILNLPYTEFDKAGRDYLEEIRKYLSGSDVDIKILEI